MIFIDEVLDFIKRRFLKDCDWLSGNCYYFAIILKNRFPYGDIYYDTINGHFLFKYKGFYYDWGGIVMPRGELILWNNFEEYDPLRKERIIRDCTI